MISNWVLVIGVVVGPALLGLLLYYGIRTSDQRRKIPGAEEATERATERLYDAEDKDVARSEAASRERKLARERARSSN